MDTEAVICYDVVFTLLRSYVTRMNWKPANEASSITCYHQAPRLHSEFGGMASRIKFTRLQLPHASLECEVGILAILGRVAKVSRKTESMKVLVSEYTTEFIVTG